MRTLGYLVARWLRKYLPNPSDPTKPLELTPGQLDFLVDWYELNESGVFTYRRAALQEPKGWGKSPLAAAMAIAEFAGPVVFDGWDAQDEPKGRPWTDPLVQIAALSEDQADSNVYSMVWSYLTANDRKAAHELGIDEGRGRLYLQGRPGKLEAVSAAAGSREGQRVTFAVLDESHLWTPRNGGIRLARTIRRNAGKMSGRTLECANAYEPGAGSVAEATAEDVAKGEAGILFVAARPSRTPEPTMADDELVPLIAEAYDDAPWVDQSRILAEIRDPSTPWDEAVRFYLNAPHAAASVLVEPKRWAELLQPGEIAEGSRVALGFDGSHAHDGTALVAVNDEGRFALELLIEREERDPPGWSVPRAEVHAAVADLFTRYEVVRMFCDPYLWRSEVEEWMREHGEETVVSFPTNSVRRFGPAVDRFQTAVAEGKVCHDGNARLARHIANARLVRGRGGAADDGHALHTLEKAGPRRYIDAAVAAVLAYEALATAEPAEEPREPMYSWA
jgi:phage terminase large subunit-like protein